VSPWSRVKLKPSSLFQPASSGTSFWAPAANISVGERAEEALALYPVGADGGKRSARELGGDLIINHGTWSWIEAQKKTGRSDIFRFRFDRAPLTPEGWFDPKPSADAGAFHAGELLYVFDNLHAFPWLIDQHDRAIAALTSNYWVATRRRRSWRSTLPRRCKQTRIRHGTNF
jgi:carboxylesterase type B